MCCNACELTRPCARIVSWHSSVGAGLTLVHQVHPQWGVLLGSVGIMVDDDGLSLLRVPVGAVVDLLVHVDASVGVKPEVVDAFFKHGLGAIVAWVPACFERAITSSKCHHHINIIIKSGRARQHSLRSRCSLLASTREEHCWVAMRTVAMGGRPWAHHHRVLKKMPVGQW